MNKEKIEVMLSELIQFYIDMHSDTPEIEPTAEMLDEMEEYIKNNLS